MDEKSLKRFEELSVNNELETNDSSEIDRIWCAFKCDSVEVDLDHAWSNVSNSIKQKSSSTQVAFFRWAASLVLLVSVVFWVAVSVLEKPEALTFQANDSDQAYRLPDNSSIILSKGSTIQYSESDEIREVFLLGSAFFDVQEKENVPFLIHSDQLVVEVVGTSFEVISENETHKLAVKDGKVIVSYESEDWSLAKGDALTIDIKSNSFKKYSKLDNLSDHWQSEISSITNQRMDKVMEILAYKHGLDISYSTKGIKKCLVSGSFDFSDLSSTLDKLALAVSFTFSLKENKLQISGEGC